MPRITRPVEGVVQDLVDGKTMKVIAIEEGVSRAAIGMRIDRLRKELGAKTKFQVIAMLIAKGRIDVERFK